MHSSVLTTVNQANNRCTTGSKKNRMILSDRLNIFKSVSRHAVNLAIVSRVSLPLLTMISLFSFTSYFHRARVYIRNILLSVELWNQASVISSEAVVVIKHYKTTSEYYFLRKLVSYHNTARIVTSMLSFSHNKVLSWFFPVFQ